MMAQVSPLPTVAISPYELNVCRLRSVAVTNIVEKMPPGGQTGRLPYAVVSGEKLIGEKWGTVVVGQGEW